MNAKRGAAQNKPAHHDHRQRNHHQPWDRPEIVVAYPLEINVGVDNRGAVRQQIRRPAQRRIGANSAANAAARRVALGSLLFKLVGSLIILPFVHLLAETMGKLSLPKAELVIYFHVFYNLVRCLVMLPFVDPMARFCKTIIRDEPELDTQLRPKHLDVSALDTPTLALANAASVS